MPRDFLLEVGTEELPASACRAAANLFPGKAASLFASADLEVVGDKIQVLVSPRRIALLIKDFPEEQTARQNVQRGPAEDSAFGENGVPTKAAEGFARAKGAEVPDLEIREFDGRRFVCVVTTTEARPTADVLPDILPKLVEDAYFPKNMKWGPKNVRFSRPIRWLVALFGEDVVPFEAAGIASGRRTYGHRSLGGSVEMRSASQYVETMRSAKVLVDHEEREHIVREELESLADGAGLQVIDPMEKMKEVMFLVEWPTTLAGSFGEDHLRLPDEVLITAMQSHQRYYPLVDSQRNLTNRFLFVMNGDPEYAEGITKGNERVLEGRIEDAEFSFDKDVATGLEAMADGLDKVVFHDKLGSLRDKTDRLVVLVEYLADALGVEQDDRDSAREAARLSKADQASVMVREFADLEGTMGEYYARMDGWDGEVAQAIREQYLPDAAQGSLPRSKAGALLATAEKVDNVVAAYACGEPPSGSKDPYGLRRAAMGMVNIAFLHSFRYEVEDLVRVAYEGMEDFPALVPGKEAVPQAADFIRERLVRALVDSGLSRDSVESVLPTSRVFLDLRTRAASLDSFRSSACWEDLDTVFTRPSNLAKKLPEGEAGPPVDTQLFVDEAEGVLYGAWTDVAERVGVLLGDGEYLGALEALAGLRPQVDRFFDDALVMHDDEGIRMNRLRLLAGIAGTVKSVVHLDRLQG